jgi:hypothetical protein
LVVVDALYVVVQLLSAEKVECTPLPVGAKELLSDVFPFREEGGASHEEKTAPPQLQVTTSNSFG